MASMSPVDQMQEIVTKRGADLSRADLREIDFLTTKLPLDDAFEQRGWIDEAISLVINDLAYAGDITHADIAD